MQENSNDSSTLRDNITEVISKDVQPHQVLRSQTLRNELYTTLNIYSSEINKYLINIEEYVKNNIKDASYLKRQLIDKVNANLGD